MSPLGDQCLMMMVPTLLCASSVRCASLIFSRLNDFDTLGTISSFDTFSSRSPSTSATQRLAMSDGNAPQIKRTQKPALLRASKKPSLLEHKTEACSLQ